MTVERMKRSHFLRRSSDGVASNRNTTVKYLKYWLNNGRHKRKKNHVIIKHTEKVFIGTQTRRVCVCVCVHSVANRNQDHSDVVGTAPPHRLAGQLLAGAFQPQVLVGQFRPQLRAALLRGRGWVGLDIRLLDNN